MTPKTEVALATSVVIRAISDSEAAELLPSDTITLANRSISDTDSPVTFRILARDLTAVSPDKSEALPSLATVTENFSRFSAPETPTWPAV